MSHRPGESESWEEAGARNVHLAAHHNVVLVAGAGAPATSRAAIGLALAEARRRGVVVADAWGDLPEIEELANTQGDAHGLSDYLLFGISFRQLEHEVPGSPALRVVLSGNDTISQPALFEHSRWDQLLARVRRTGELLLLVARVGTPGLESLSLKVDGVIVVGDAVRSNISNVLGRVERETRADAVADAPPPVGGEAPRAPDDTPENPPTTSSTRRITVPRMLVLAIVGLAATYMVRSFGDNASEARSILTRHGDASPALPDDSAPSPLELANPRDSAAALGYAVEVAAINSSTGAVMRALELREVAVSTVTPIRGPDGSSWFVVYSGAFRTREAADSLQAELREMGVQLSEGDRVVNLPFALELATHRSEDAATADLDRYISLELPAYLLQQNDGSLTIYAGAFATREQSLPLSEACAARGVMTRLAYRTGRD